MRWKHWSPDLMHGSGAAVMASGLCESSLGLGFRAWLKLDLVGMVSEMKHSVSDVVVIRPSNGLGSCRSRAGLKCAKSLMC